MEKYIKVQEIQEKVPFVNLAITKKDIDAKNIATKSTKIQTIC